MFNNNKLAKSVRLAIAFGAAATLFGPQAYAQEAEEAADDELEKITVTGSRIKRTDLEGPQQLLVITADDMASKGNVTVFDALTNLSQNGAFQFEGPESQAFTPDVQTLNLRGIGVGNTLVLLNGRRAANYPAPHQASASVFNFGAIPAAAVERIEIVSSGASAVYGSDAVAGVINVVLKKDIDDTTFDYMYGTPTGSKSTKDTHRFQVVTGKTFEKGNITAVFEYQDREGIQADDYDEYDDSQLDYPYAERNGQAPRSRINLDLNRWNAFSGLPTYVDPGSQAACDAIGNGTVYSFRSEATGNFCGYNSAGDVNFRNEKQQWSMLLSGNYELDSGIQLYADVMYYGSESRSHNGLSPYVSEEILQLDNVVPNIFFGEFPEWTVQQRAFTAEELQMSLDETYEDDSLSFAAGAMGTIGDHDWDFYVTRSEYSLDSKRPWWKAQEYFDTFLGEQAVDPLFGETVSFFGDNWYTGEGPFGIRYNATTPITDENRSIITNALGFQTYGNETSTTSAAFNLTGDLYELPAGAISYALVVEYEKQEFEFIPDELIQQEAPIPNTTGSGWYQLTGYNGKGDRTRSALGVEFLVPVHETLNVNIAARADNYDSESSSIGTRVTPSVKLEYRPTENLLVRSGYTEIFRAPDLNQVFTSTGFFTSQTDRVSCLDQDISEARNGGNSDASAVNAFEPNDCEASSSFVRRVGAQELDPDAERLKDETGESFWLGMSYDVTDELSFTIDYTQLVLDDKVETESIRDLLSDEYICTLQDRRDQANSAGDSDLASAYSAQLGNSSATDSRCNYVSNRIDRQRNNVTGVSFVNTFNATAVNQSSERSEYIDVAVDFSKEVSWGEISVDLDYSHLLTYEQRQRVGDEWEDLRDSRTLATGYVPRSTITGTFNWTNNEWRAALSFNSMGSTVVWDATELEDDDYYRVSSYTRWNLFTSYDWNEDLTISLTVANLFDAEPPRDETIGPTDFPWYNVYTYSGAGIGRQVYANINYTF